MAMGPLRLHKGRHAFFCVEARAYAIARTGLCNRAHGLMQSRARAYAIARTGLCNRAHGLMQSRARAYAIAPLHIMNNQRCCLLLACEHGQKYTYERGIKLRTSPMLQFSHSFLWSTNDLIGLPPEHNIIGFSNP